MTHARWPRSLAGLFVMLAAAMAISPGGVQAAAPSGTVSSSRSSAPNNALGLRTGAGPFTGNIGISADGLGVAQSSTGTLQARIPLPDSTIVTALLYSKTLSGAHLSQIGFGGQTIQMTELPHSLVDDPPGNPDFFPTFRGDVTSIVADAVGGGSGTFSFPVDEDVTGIGTLLVDGEALFVVFANPALPSREVYLLEGGLTGPDLDTVSLPLVDPYAGGPVEMGVGISFSGGSAPIGHECLHDGQTTHIRVEGTLITPCGGHMDDADSNANGALMTVGGVGDDTRLPGVTGVDDEKYNIAPFVELGSQAIDMTFLNPSGDDSLFALYVQVTKP